MGSNPVSYLLIATHLAEEYDAIYLRRTCIDRILDWPNGFWSTWMYLFKHTKRTPFVKPRGFGQSKIRSIRCLPLFMAQGSKALIIWATLGSIPGDVIWMGKTGIKLWQRWSSTQNKNSANECIIYPAVWPDGFYSYNYLPIYYHEIFPNWIQNLQTLLTVFAKY